MTSTRVVRRLGALGLNLKVVAWGKVAGKRRKVEKSSDPLDVVPAVAEGQAYAEED